MALFDKAKELTRKVSETTASVAKSAAMAAKEKSEQAIELGKVRKDILVENGKINKLYEDIGKHAFDIYNSSKDYTLLEPLLEQIADSVAKIEDFKAKAEEIKAASNISDDDALPDDGDADDADTSETD